ncbi:SPOR domain-containing protein [Cesiribacter andamanensis]|uniref:Ezrin/radixin/moesin family protein n=1 Tax=Cesiribacter andamanensis AMV16 TaxID=1279009 RepID=M7NAR7_9BACT|nr:SPOR domain-containing protein [Cesiribacter andamanensis]EMR04357.1 Ezrin/radixin/moesin family protein [Cesiribacter andamanensis AMV16]
MKKVVLAVATLLCLTLAFDASAQLSKKEKKEWKKQMKDMDVEAFKKLVEEKEALESQVAGLNSQVSSLQSRANEKTTEADRLKSEVKDLQNQLAEARTAQEATNTIDATGNKNRVAKGVVFKVQIGAFRNKDLAKYFESNGSFDGEVDNSTQRYTLGQFTDYWEADKFKKYLREMGVKDAWIVSYKDGVRVPLKDVLEGVL